MKTTHLIRSMLLSTLTWGASAYGVTEYSAPSAELDDGTLVLDCAGSSCYASTAHVGSRLHVFEHANSKRIFSFAYDETNECRP